MQLWHGSIDEFISEGSTGTLPAKMMTSFYNHKGSQPSPSETRSWENSLKALSRAVDGAQKQDIGVVLEYHLPYSNHRIDALFFGTDLNGNNAALLVELKQWSKVTLAKGTSLNVLMRGTEDLHPSQQALDYSNHLTEIQSAVETFGIKLYPCSYLHNYKLPKKPVLRDKRFKDILDQCPTFFESEEIEFFKHFQQAVGNGCGVSLKDKFVNGRFKPTKKLLDVLEKVIKGDDKWALIGSQRLAYNAIWDQLVRMVRKKRKPNNSAILVRGGPGSGKTVIATQLLADALKMDYVAVHSNGGKAFRTVLQSEFDGADKLFIWNLHLRNQPEQGLDLLLVDEAHRIRKDSNLRYTPRSKRSTISQVEEMLKAAKVAVFLLDDNQFVRPDEIGSSELIRSETKRLGVPLIEYDLDTQFRCGGCTEYSDWINYLLEFSDDLPKHWNTQYSFSLVDDPTELESLVTESEAKGENARMVAGFCWPWSDPNPNGSLVNNVVIGDWERPWNKKDMGKRYKPKNHPYTLWAKTKTGQTQIGCIYSAQGFEFDRVGVIWGSDLVWRNGKWVGQKSKTYDPPLKYKKSDTTILTKNAYRVLLTRGMKETRLLCLDEETRLHIESVLEELHDQ